MKRRTLAGLALAALVVGVMSVPPPAPAQLPPPPPPQPAAAFVTSTVGQLYEYTSPTNFEVRVWAKVEGTPGSSWNVRITMAPNEDFADFDTAAEWNNSSYAACGWETITLNGQGGFTWTDLRVFGPAWVGLADRGEGWCWRLSLYRPGTETVVDNVYGFKVRDGD